MYVSRHTSPVKANSQIARLLGVIKSGTCSLQRCSSAEAGSLSFRPPQEAMFIEPVPANRSPSAGGQCGSSTSRPSPTDIALLTARRAEPLRNRVYKHGPPDGGSKQPIIDFRQAMCLPRVSLLIIPRPEYPGFRDTSIQPERVRAENTRERLRRRSNQRGW
jgi:hypothetical protein